VPGDRSDSARAAFVAAVDGFLATVDAIGPGQWVRDVSDAWTVRQLVAHVVRGMAVISEYLDAGLPAPDVLLPDAAAYFRAALGMDGVHAGIADRGVAAAAGAGDDVPAWAREVAASAVARVAATADDEVVVHFAGAIRFLDYLDTRTTELVLHSLELQVACGLGPHAPADALAVVNRVLLALVDRADPVALALALTGRPGPPTCNVLG
jgi:hypothetical protein